jgi:nucleotide-binding universal stress UspA family protein
MSTANGAPIVVGVDGSESARRAVRLAAAEAVTRRRPLRLVHAFIWPMLRVAQGPPPGGPPEGGLRRQAERIVEEAAAEAATAVTPDTPIDPVVVDGSAATVLLGEAQTAAMVVLGHRGLGGFSTLLVGSVAVQVAAHAECPVVVALGEEERSVGPVVVGVDGSPLSEEAIGFALEEAALRGAELVALHAWSHPVSTGPGDMMPLVYDEEDLRANEERVLAESVAGWSQRYPEVPVTRRLVRGRPARALVEESQAAQLVVVGALGRGGFTGLILGSVSQAVLHHSACPLAIVRHDQGGG